MRTPPYINPLLDIAILLLESVDRQPINSALSQFLKLLYKIMEIGEITFGVLPSN